jgi:hypothetical protein
MKQLILMLILSLGLNVKAQQSETDNVKSKIIEFFDAFHKQDTVALKSIATDKVILQSISEDKYGKTVLKEDDFNQFVKSIARIPKDKKFEEKLLGFNIQVDGNMANAWTPYEFWYEGEFSHCGVNSFQLIKDDGEWKIIYLVDTRRKEGC